MLPHNHGNNHDVTPACARCSYEGMTMFRSLFDVLNVPYVGCSAECMALATDKAHTKAILSSAGVQVPRGEVLKKGDPVTVKVLSSPPEFVFEPPSPWS